MSKRHEDDIARRMEAINDVGAVYITKTELMRWLGDKRIVTASWAKLSEYWRAACECDKEDLPPLLLSETDGGYWFFSAGKSVSVPRILECGSWKDTPWLQFDLKEFDELRKEKADVSAT
jgi:hypothetical protein